MQYENITLGALERSEVQLQHTATRRNYLDIYHSSDAYALSLPSSLGLEPAGVVEAMGMTSSGFGRP